MKTKIYFILSLLTITLISEECFGGRNAGAKVFLDLNISSDTRDSTGFCQKDSLITVGIYVSAITQMFAFEADIQYDTSSLQYVSMKTETDNVPNIFKVNGASITSTTSNYQGRKNTRAVAASILGMDEEQCAAGDGYVAFVIFKKLNQNNSLIDLFQAIIIDFDEGEDVFKNVSKGTVYTGVSTVGNRIAKPYMYSDRTIATLQIMPSAYTLNTNSIVNLLGRRCSAQQVENRNKQNKNLYSPRIVIYKNGNR